VDSQATDIARGALVHERLEPAQTLAIVGGGGDGGRDELGLASVRSNVVLVVASGVRSRHASLGGHIGLIETQDVLATAGQSSLDGGDPATEVPGAPEHRDEVNAARKVAGEGHSPVVSPSNVTRAGHSRDSGNVVVSSTALASAALLDLNGGGEGGGGHEAGSEQLGEGNHFVCCCFRCCSWIDPK